VIHGSRQVPCCFVGRLPADQEVPVRLLGLRALVIVSLVVFYMMNPLLGIAGLVSAFAYTIWSRRIRVPAE
jgi:hypothetical protein